MVADSDVKALEAEGWELVKKAPKKKVKEVK